jgi:hypothetical protein
MISDIPGAGLQGSRCTTGASSATTKPGPMASAASTERLKTGNNEMRKILNFKVTQADGDLICAIVARAADTITHPPIDRWKLHMDLTACHANGCPLQLAELLQADLFEFTHDVCGIQRHIDRRTGKMGGCFWPRFAVQQ